MLHFKSITDIVGGAPKGTYGKGKVKPVFCLHKDTISSNIDHLEMSILNHYCGGWHGEIQADFVLFFQA